MRPLTSGVFQRLMQQTFPQIDTLDVGRLLLNYVLSDLYADVALVGGHETCLSEPRSFEISSSSCAVRSRTAPLGLTRRALGLIMGLSPDVPHRWLAIGLPQPMKEKASGGAST